MKHILVVDDDPAMRSLITEYLTQHALRVTAVSDSREMNRVLGNDPVDVVVVDLNLGHEDGLEIVRSLPSKVDVPVIIISGDRLDEADKVIGLELGASDYITKPFGTREFLARIRAALRINSSLGRSKDKRSYRFAEWSLNLKQRRLISPSGEEIKLTASEFNLLVALLGKPREVLTREKLLSASRVHEEEVYDRSIDVLVLRLRRKLEEDPSEPQLIKTVRGIGYMLDTDVDTYYGKTTLHRERRTN